jgi:hypothetical protein
MEHFAIAIMSIAKRGPVRLDRGYLVRRSVWLDDRLVASTGLNAGGLPGAVGLTNLQVLDLRFTRVTEAGLKELRKALPGCTISRADIPDLKIPK